MYPQPVAFGILASPVRQLFICSDCFHFNNVSKQYVQSFYTCSSQNKTHLRYKVPIFKTPQLNHLIFTQNCQNILIYGISFSSLFFSDNGQTSLFFHHSYPVFWDRAKKKYMSVYGYILQKNRVGRSNLHFILFFHFISYTEILDCGPIRIRKRYRTLEYIWLLSGLKVL